MKVVMVIMMYTGENSNKLCIIIFYYSCFLYHQVFRLEITWFLHALCMLCVCGTQTLISYSHVPRLKVMTKNMTVNL